MRLLDGVRISRLSKIYWNKRRGLAKYPVCVQLSLVVKSILFCFVLVEKTVFQYAIGTS